MLTAHFLLHIQLHCTLQCNTHCKTYTEYFCTLDTHQSIWVLHIEHWHNNTHWHIFLHTAHFTHRHTPDFLHTANAHLTNTRLAAQWSLNAHKTMQFYATKCKGGQHRVRSRTMHCTLLQRPQVTLCNFVQYKNVQNIHYKITKKWGIRNGTCGARIK